MKTISSFLPNEGTYILFRANTMNANKVYAKGYPYLTPNGAKFNIKKDNNNKSGLFRNLGYK
jgi:hypothetical protein